MDETNHLFYKQLWVDKGGNVGIECDRCGNTIWGTHSVPRLTLNDAKTEMISCPNDQALMQSNFCQTETARHQAGEEQCVHKPSQP